MRIALISETWLPSVDGVVTRLRHTVAQLLEARHRVLVVAPTAGPPIPGLIQYRSRAVVVPFIDPARPWAVPDRRGIARALEAFHPSVVHVVNPVLMGSGAVLYAAGRCPVVASYHTDISAYTSRYRLGWTRPLLRRLTRNAYRRADVRLATSPTGQARLAELGICNASIWPPAVDVARFRPDEARPARPSQPERISAVCVGRLSREKNCEVLAPVLAAAAASGPELRLTFVGDGPDRRRLQGLFAGRETIFTGLLRDGSLATAYAEADVLLFTS